MACWLTQAPAQTPAQRKTEVDKAIARIDKFLAARKVKVTVGPQGAVTFDGISDDDRARMSDACIYRLITRKGSAAAKMALARAEQMAGRKIDRAVVNAGVHSHDGGRTWSAH